MNNFYNEDILTFLSKIKNTSIDTFILDPPYMNVVKEKWDNQWKNIDEYCIWCEQWIKEISRISKKSGTLWLFGFPYQLSYLLPIVEKYGFSFRQQIVIWKGMKSAAGRTSSKLKMYPTTTESIFFFNYDSCNIIKNILNKEKEKSGLSCKEINTYLGKATNGGGTWSGIAGLKQQTLVQPTKEDWTKLNTLFNNNLPKYEDYVFNFNLLSGLTDVWDDIDFYKEIKHKIHPTQKPYSLIDRILKTACNQNSVILDPFMGSGTTAIVCDDMKLQWMGCDFDKEMYEKTLKRIKDNRKKKIFLNNIIG